MKFYRKEAGMSRLDLVKMISASRPAISQYEIEPEPTIRVHLISLKMSKVLNVSMNELMKSMDILDGVDHQV